MLTTSTSHMRSSFLPYSGLTRKIAIRAIELRKISSGRRVFVRAAWKSLDPCAPSLRSCPFSFRASGRSFHDLLRKWIARVTAAPDARLGHAHEIRHEVFFSGKFFAHAFVYVERHGRNAVDGQLRKNIFAVIDSI